MRTYLLAALTAATVLGCSQDDVKNEGMVAKEATAAASVENCNRGSINAGQYNMVNNVWGSNPGPQCIWYNNINSWGANASHTASGGIKAYPSMIYGCHWGYCSQNTGLPKQISSLGNVRTWWTQSSSGDAYDAAYDLWFDPVAYPGNRANRYELMIWLQWRNTKPIAQSYDAGGNAIPYARNVSLSGRTWNVYRRGDVFSFLPTSQTNWISIDAKPLIDYCVARGWMPGSSYMTSVQAGWEVIRGGTFSTSSYGVGGI